MNIILMGYRGCGKSSLGKLIAEQLWKDFVDLDDEIVKRFDGMSIADIFSKHGEPAFRETETAAAIDLLAKDEQVIALGGGAVITPACKEAIEKAEDAVRIYLECDPKVLYERIHGDPASQETRPNLTDLGGGLEEIESLLAKRDPIYRAVADKVFDVTDIGIENGVRFLIDRCL